MGRQTNRVGWFSIKGSQQQKITPSQEMMQVCFPHYFSYVLLFFFPQVFPTKKTERMNMKHAFRWQLLFFAVGFCFLKGLGHTARSIDCLHGAIGNLSEDSAPVGVFQSQWSRGTSEISAEKTPPFEVTRRCQDVPSPLFFLFFSGFFGGKFQGFLYNSTKTTCWKGLKKNGGFAFFSWMIWGGFWLDAIFWRLTWRKNCETWGCHG